LRYFYLKTKEQVSFKKRFMDYKKLNFLNFGNHGFITKKSLRFEFSNFLIFKKFLKIFLKSKYSLKKFFSFWFFLFGNYPITKKSKNARMGKGKGVFLRWSIRIPFNFIFLEFNFFNSNLSSLIFFNLRKNISKNILLIK